MENLLNIQRRIFFFLTAKSPRLSDAISRTKINSSSADSAQRSSISTFSRNFHVQEFFTPEKSFSLVLAQLFFLRIHFKILQLFRISNEISKWVKGNPVREEINLRSFWKIFPNFIHIMNHISVRLQLCLYIRYTWRDFHRMGMGWRGWEWSWQKRRWWW